MARRAFLLFAACGPLTACDPGEPGLPSAPIPAIRVAGNLTWSAISAGVGHTCAISVSGDTYCWGANGSGQLGTGSSELLSSVPTRVTGALKFTAVASGFAHTCALADDGAAHCWGGNHMAQLGRGASSLVSEPTPQPVGGGLRFVSITAGDAHSCALTSPGAAYCWGADERAESGPRSGASDCNLPIDGVIPQLYFCHATPAAVAIGTTFTGIAASAGGTCGVTSAGEILCWGHIAQGAAPVGICRKNTHAGPFEVPCNATPVLVNLGVTSPSTMLTAGAGSHYACALNSARWYCWSNEGTTSDDPPQAYAYVQPASYGLAHYRCGLTTAGAAFCWGRMWFDDSEASEVVEQGPSPVTGIAERITAMSVAFRHACALGVSGAAYCWGNDEYGQLGQGAP